MPQIYPDFSTCCVVFDKVVLLRGTCTDINAKNNCCNGSVPMQVGEIAIATDSKEINHLFSTCELRRIPFPAPTACRHATAIDFQMHRANDAQSATGCYSVIAGGYNNTVSGSFSNINGGTQNYIQCGSSTTISGGYNNFICNASSSAIGGGEGNCIIGIQGALIGGGGYNTICNYSSYSVIAGGTSNTASAYKGFNFIGTGAGNTASGYIAAVTTGSSNIASGDYSTISSGYTNIASGCHSVIGSGCSNTASGNYSFIATGCCNNTNGLSGTFILGTRLIASKANYTYVNNISSQNMINTNTLAIGVTASGAVGGSNIGKFPIYNSNNQLLGYVPIYTS